MTEIDKKRQEIIEEYKLSFAKLLELPKFNDREVKESLQKINEDLINFIHCCKSDSEQLCDHKNRTQNFVDIISRYESCLDCGKDL